MKIGIDARMWGPRAGGGGLGRYVEELVRELMRLDHQNQYVLFRKSEIGDRPMAEKKEERPRIRSVMTHAHWYTLKEQLMMPWLIDKEHLDLIHFPHWNVPLLLRTPFVVTIHDLILIEEPRSATATTRHPVIYWIKRVGYRLVLRNALKRSCSIIAVSHYTKSSIEKHFPWVPPEKIHVIYEGVTSLSLRDPDSTRSSPQSPTLPSSTPSFLYVGNAYPHKNLEKLLQAFALLHRRRPKTRLILAGRHDIFFERIKRSLAHMDLKEKAVEYVPDPSDEDLARLYSSATAYVFPSKSEGFGLPPLEAMSFGVPVLAAHRTSLPEILNDTALWFDPDDVEDMTRAMERMITDNHLRSTLSRKGCEQTKKYTWSAMARETLALYQTCGS